jgi:hypothetical protein
MLCGLNLSISPKFTAKQNRIAYCIKLDYTLILRICFRAEGPIAQLVRAPDS